jgi:hypothetical protein
VRQTFFELIKFFYGLTRIFLKIKAIFAA